MPKKYRIAAIGRTGHGDYGHGIDVLWAQVPNAEIVAVADDNEAGLAAAAKRLKVERAFSDYRTMLDDVKPDVVSIAPRWIDQHRDMILAAVERGIHVFTEKPFCRTLAEADEIVAACERTHVKLAIAHPTRYAPKAETAKRLIAAGKVGRVLEYRGRGKEDSRGGGEDLWVLGSHVMDLIRFFAGHPQWCFATVTASGRSIRKSDVHEGPEGLGPLAGDAVHALYGLADGATAYFSSLRGAGDGARFALQIFGTAGVLEIDTGNAPHVKYLADASWSPGRSGARWQDVSSAGIALAEPADKAGLHLGNILAAQDLLAAIEEHREPKGGVYEARGATEMILAVFESQRVGGPVPLPLKNRQHPLAMLA